MPGPDHQHQRVAIEFRGGELAFFRQIRNHSDVELVIQQFARNFAREHAMHANVNPGMQSPVTVQCRQQRVDGTFIYTQ